MQNILQKIYDYSLEEIMGSRFSRYSKAIIQDRALPDVRDGLKPVQRRILYSMYRDNNTFDKPYQKSAKAVGNVMGKYHPHGDSSIYEAMVRLSQWWKQNNVYIDMHGNNGSIDGDEAAAMRYTEARLSKVAVELLKEIDRNTVTYMDNYDGSLKEPVVLPAKFPNLLVNGGSGISAGYATNIPPHNLGEVIDATIKMIDNPSIDLDAILNIVKGPDFPTGGIAFGKKGIRDAFKTGRGKVVVQAKYSIENNKGKKQIIIHEIPFEVNKQTLRTKIDEIRIDKKIDGILEVRDESDMNEPMRIVIDIKKDADQNLIVNYLLKNTDLQVNYNYNMVAIVNKRPMTLGIIQIIDAYIKHLKEITYKRTEYDLQFAKTKMHNIEGLIKAVSILDEVIKTIRESNNKADAKINLQTKYGFTESQSEVIVMLHLYKLSNTDIIELEENHKNLKITINYLESILNNEEIFKNVMKEELLKIKKEYATPRKTIIEEELLDIKIDIKDTITKEDVIVVVSNDGYLKRVSPRSYNASNKDQTMLKDGDYVIKLANASTIDTLLLFTNLGNYLYIPVFEIPDLKWGELGKHVSNIIKLTENERIIDALIVDNFKKDQTVSIFTKLGMVKSTLLSEFDVTRYSKPLVSIKLKKEDEVVSVSFENSDNVIVITKRGYALKFETQEIPVTGIRTSGVKAISLKEDEVVGAHIYNIDSYLLVVTDKGTAKRVKVGEISKFTRARKGNRIIREVITNPYYIEKTFLVTNKEILFAKVKTEFHSYKMSDIVISDQIKTGTALNKNIVDDWFIETSLEEKDETISQNIEEIKLDEIDKNLSTIDSLLDNF